MGKKKPKIIQLPQTPESQFRTRARKLPLGTCFINENWENSREAIILITRKHKQDGITFGYFLVDLAALGVRDCFFRFNMPSGEYQEFMKDFQENGDIIEVDYSLVHNLIYGAIDFADEYGFSPHHDFNITQYILEEDNDAVPLIDIEFGLEGMPTIFCDDDNPMTREITQLRSTAGDGFYKVINVDKEGDWLDEIDFFPVQPDENDPLIQKINHLRDSLGALAPWTFFDETDLFAVQSPTSKVNYYISIMGSEEVFMGISAYIGEQALFRFWEFVDSDRELPFQTIMAIAHINVSLLNKPDQFDWPDLISFTPGKLPVTPDKNELEDLVHILSQTIELSKRAKKKQAPPIIFEDNTEELLFRIPDQKGTEIRWRDEIREPVFYTPDVTVNYNRKDLDIFNKLPFGKDSVEIDLCMLQKPVKENGSEPFFPFVFLVVDAKSGMVEEAKIMNPVPDYAGMLGKLPAALISKCIELKEKPKMIFFCHADLHYFIDFFEKYTDVEVEYSHVLPSLDEALHSLLESFDDLAQ